MTTATKTTGFRPIFNATVTPGDSIENLKSATGTDYIKMTDAAVQTTNGSSQRTVMAFGKSAEDVRDLLVSGEPVELAVQYDGGSVKVIGRPREETPAAAEG